MFIKILHIIYIFTFLKLFYGYQLSHSFEDNYDIKLLKNYMKENNNSYIYGKTKNEFFTLDDLAALESSMLQSYKTGYTWTIRNLYLFTRDYRNGTAMEYIDPRNVSSIKNCHFQTRPTYVLVHGFIGYGLEPWIVTLKNKLLEREDCNVISVDWPAGKEWFLPTYYSAAHRVAVVGNETATLLDSLVQYKGLRLQDVHCVGHSLGGHVCGFAGKPFGGRIGRISGLDPAGPLFHKVQPSQRLDRKDAVYVDVIHTNACVKWPYWTDCYGLNENVGHSNFFPNGGEHQPGCSSSLLRGDIGCDHERAYLLYIFSLNFSSRGTYFLARQCDNWVSYEIGNCSCGNYAQFMGMNVNTELEGNYYLETKAHEPYAMEDPECSFKRQWNVLIVVGYVIVVGFVLCCVFSVVVLVVENIRRTCCTPLPKDDEDPLFSSEDDDDDTDDDDDYDEEEHVERGCSHNGNEKGVTVSVVSSADTCK